MVLALTMLMLGGFVLRCYTALDLYIHPWDERYHALVAKNLMSHPLRPTLYDKAILPYDYKDWGQNHIWLHKQPLALWVISASMYLFGINEIALRLPSILLTTIGIGLTFSIGKQLFSNRVGYVAAFLFAIHGNIIELAAGRVTTDHIDIFFLFFILLGVWLALKYAHTKHVIYNILCGLAIGLAILSKWLPALIVLPIWLLLVVQSSRFKIKEIIIQFLLLCLITAIIFLPWQIFIYHQYPQEARWESLYNFRHITETIEGHTGGFLYYIDKVRIVYGELIYLPLIWLLWYTLKNIKNKKWLILTVWIFIPLIFFSFVKTKLQGYILITAPALFITTAYFWTYLNRYRNKLKPRFLVLVVLFLLIAFPIRYSIERIKPFEKIERYPAWVKNIKALHTTSNTIVFNTDRHIEIMFYTDAIAYPQLPSIELLENLIKNGYEIIIIDNGKLGNAYKGLYGTKIGRL